MKLEIYQEKPKDSEEMIVRFALGYDGGDVALHVVDENGKHVAGGNIIKVSKRGTIYRYQGINSSLGFQLDHLNRVRVDGEKIDD